MFRQLACVMVVTALGLPGVAGCGGGNDYEIKVSRPAAERPDLKADDALVAKGALRLPADLPFNMSSYSSGQTGEATGKSSARADGVAEATATAQGKGTAFGEFQIGYTFDNISDRPLDAVIRLKTDCGHTLGVSGPDSTTAEAALTFFLKDSNGTTLHSEPLVHGEAQKRAHQWSGVVETVIEARFEPGLGYYLVVAGRASVDVTDAKKVSAMLAVRNCELNIEWRPAGAASAGSAASAQP